MKASFELLPPPVHNDKLEEGSLPDMGNNRACTDDFLGSDSQMAECGSPKDTGNTD
ncbi:hypothetical protein ACFXTH_035927 [Malus domestica]